MSALSESTALNREALYRALSKDGNPTLETLARILQAVGLRISVVAEPSASHLEAT
jgi:probable addiction module antidote protein